MITLNKVNKYYKKKQVLFEFTTKIEENNGKIYGLIGPNGAGKTTVLKLIAGIYLVEESMIYSDSSKKDYYKWARDNIAYVAVENRTLNMKNTIWDNIMYFSCLKGADLSLTKLKLDKYWSCFNINEELDTRIENLSYGNQKKIGILCALCSGRSLILLDEPSIGLDIDTTEELIVLLQNLNQKFGNTFIISSHDVDFISKIVNHYIFIKKGTVTFEAPNKLELDEIHKLNKKL